MFAKVKVFGHYRFAVLVDNSVAIGVFSFPPYDAAGKVDIVVDFGKFGQTVHVVLKHAALGVFAQLSLMLLGIVVKFTLQHAISSLSVLVGTMSLKVVFHLPSAIELIGSSQITAFHLVEDGLRINHPAFGKVEVYPCTQKLLS